MVVVIIIVALLLLAGLIYVLARNGIISLRNRTEEAWSGIDVQLKRRHDLIPNLVESVKAYAAHEQGVFDEVSQARASTLSATGVAQASDAAGRTSAALGRLFAVADAYPQLRASENFQRLQEELTDTEDKIAAARRYYNTVVQQFNTAQQTFPASLAAGTFGFAPREFFRLEDDGDRAPVSVSL
jgi:LemA protein